MARGLGKDTSGKTWYQFRGRECTKGTKQKKKKNSCYRYLVRSEGKKTTKVRVKSPVLSALLTEEKTLNHR